MLLAGKKALVTGGKRNIGRGIALALAEAGCDVGINDLERDGEVEETLQLIRDMGREASFFEADISRAVQVASMTSAFVEAFGGIDILVNNPYSGGNQPFLEITEENWDHTLGVCLKGYFLCSQQAARAMVAAGKGGSIVSVSSVHAGAVWQADTCYGVAKAGILRLTRSMAVELGRHRIRCNAILPGYMDVEHEYGSPPPEPQPDDAQPTQRFTPTYRPSTPEEIGRTVVFLCSPGANISGVALPVDGGLLAS